VVSAAVSIFQRSAAKERTFPQSGFYYNSRSPFDYYEHRSPNPALDFIERAAAALEVTVAKLLGSEPFAA
jgi:hypothetical protein